MRNKLLLTCEHACLFIPDEFVQLFKNQNGLVKSPEGWDIGAYQTFKAIRKVFRSDAYYGKWSRLVVDLNRSEHHRHLFSEVTKDLPDAVKEDILRKYYYPYRHQIIHQIEQNKKEKFCTLHLSIHSFTADNKNAKKTDIGVLYDPARKKEKGFATQFKGAVQDLELPYEVRMNFPFLGTSDGLTAHLRKHYSEKHYVGIELELNQKHFKNRKKPDGIVDNLVKALIETLK